MPTAVVRASCALHIYSFLLKNLFGPPSQTHPQRRAQQQAPVLLHTHATELALPSGMTGMEERHFARALASLRPPFLASVIALKWCQLPCMCNACQARRATRAPKQLHGHTAAISVTQCVLPDSPWEIRGARATCMCLASTCKTRIWASMPKTLALGGCTRLRYRHHASLSGARLRLA